ncbi:MAG TPA: AraC family transcriptional regulator, partial [Gemmatimonadota bacterium]|nr:AraC family transcriptional regulator [Gemmatimonadota bacterium]
TELLAAPGDALLFPEQIEYRTSHPQDGGDHGIGIRVDPGTLEEILGRAGHRKVDPDGLLSTRALVTPRVVLRLRLLIDALDGGQPMALDVDETALLLLGQAAGGIVEASGGCAGRTATRHAHRKAVERVMEMVQARLQEKLGLEEIAREAAYSPYHLCRVFKEQTGMTIHAYVNRQRLLRGLELLEEEESFAQLAARLGFASHSHFTMAFTSTFNHRPSEHRIKSRLRSSQHVQAYGAPVFLGSLP